MLRIFIVGAPRTGTTLLQSMLLSGNGLFSPKETHFMRNGWITYRTFYKVFNFRRSYLRNKEIKYNILDILIGTRFARKIIHSLDEKVDELNLSGWIEKTPEHIFFIDELNLLAPSSKFIIIERDGKAVVPSIVNMWSSYTTNWGHIRNLKVYISDVYNVISIYFKYRSNFTFSELYTGRRFVRAFDLWKRAINYTPKTNADILRIYYEELIQQPSKTLKLTCEFLNIKYENSMLNFQDKANNVIDEKEIWKAHNIGALFKSPSYEKFNSLDENTKHLITKLCKYAN